MLVALARRPLARTPSTARSVLLTQHRPAQQLVAESRGEQETGTNWSRKARGQYTKESRIPAVLMLPKQDPVFLKMRPGQIRHLFDNDHFLGRRYTLTVDEHTTYDVYPTHLGLHPVTSLPESVSFALFNGSPRTLWTPEYRKKVRKWEPAYLREQKLKRDMKEAKKQIKDLVSSAVPIEVVDEMPELFDVYKTDQRRKRMEKFFTLEQEVDAMLKPSREDLKAQVLSLEKEERDIDEVMPDVDDEDEA